MEIAIAKRTAECHTRGVRKLCMNCADTR
jgi:hypothetical protein